MNYDHVIKIILIGDSGVGKSTIMKTFCEEPFNPCFISTIGVDFKVKIIDIKDMKIKLQIWDTAGQERFKAITASYYRNTQGVLIVYDVNNRDTFNNITKWVNEFDNHRLLNVKKVLVGNKLDLARDVSYEEGKELADRLGLPFYEVSSKEFVNIEKVFFDLADSIVPEKQLDKIVDVTDVTKKESCNC